MRALCDCGWSNGSGAHELSCGKQGTDADWERELERLDREDTEQ